MTDHTTDPPTPNPYSRRAIKRGLIAGGCAALAASTVCFFPVAVIAASIAFAAMCLAVWLGEKLFLWFDRDDSQPDDYDGSEHA